jgi:zinc protease
VNASGGLSRRPRQERAFVIQFGCAPEAVDKLVDAAFDEIAMVARVGADPDDLEKIKQQWLRERETQLATNEFWVRWLASSARYGDDPTIVLETSPMIARMTSANVKAAAKRFLSRKPYFQAVLLPAAEK